MNNAPGDLGDDADRLLIDLAAAVGTDSLHYADVPVRFTGGFFATVVRFRLADPPADLAGWLVARLMPDEEFTRRETQVQRLVAETGFDTPRIRAFGDGSGTLGQTWSVMDAVDGSPMIDDLDPKTILRVLPDLVASLPRRMAAMAVALHNASPAELREVVPSRTPEEAADWLELDLDPQRAARVRGNELMVEELRRAVLGLRRTAPTADTLGPSRHVLCHGDLHPFNVLTTDDGTDVLIDWSEANWAAPEAELAYTSFIIGHPPLDLPPLVMSAVQRATRPIGARVVSEYVKLSGRTIDQGLLDWWTAFHAVRMLSFVARGDAQIRTHPWFGLQDRLAAIIASATGVTVHRRVR